MSQPQPQQSRKILRIGIIQGGKIIEERLLRKREPVTVGESARNTFVIASTSLPPRFPLFELKGDQYFLTIAETMDGRLSLGTGVADLQNLKQQGLARKVGQVELRDPQKNDGSRQKVAVYQVPLTEKSRGKLTFGDVTLLFQFVTPPPLPTKAQLPAIIQGGWIKGMDWVYSSILVMSFVFHSGFVYWCRITGELPETKWENLSKRFAQSIVNVQPKQEEGNSQKKDAGKDAAKKDEKKKAAKDLKKSDKPKPKQELSAEEKARRDAERQRAIREKLEKNTLLAGLIGAKSEGGGAMQDLLSEGSNVVSKGLDSALQSSGGLAVGDGTGIGSGTRRGGAGGKIGGLGNTGPTGTGGPVAGTGGRKVVKPTFRLQKIEDGEGGKLDSDKLRTTIRNRSNLFTFCYEQELKRNPTLRGSIRIRITIALTGRVTKTEIEDNSLGNDSVARCIEGHLKRGSYPKPDGEAAEVVIPFFFSPAG